MRSLKTVTSGSQGLALAERPAVPEGWPDNDDRARQMESLRCQNDVLELIAGGADIRQVFAQLARAVERVVPAVHCSVSLPEGYSLSDSEITAAMAGHPATGAAELQARLRGLGTPQDFRRCHSQPIPVPEVELDGALQIHYREDRELSADELQAIEDLARLARLAVEQVRRDGARQLAIDRLGALARSVPGVVYQLEVTPEGTLRYTYLSDAVADLFGIAPEDGLANAEALLACFDGGAPDSLPDGLVKASRSLDPWFREGWITTLEGQRRYVRDSGRPHRQADGSVLWEGVILDATQAKLAEDQLRNAKETAEAASHAKTRLLAQLRSANQRFAALVASVPGVVYQRKVTPEGQIHYTYISDGVKDLFGITPEEVISDSQVLFDCHGPEYRKDFRERLLAASQSLSLWDVEAQIITAKGETKYTHAIARPHRQPDGSVLWDGIILDATRIKRAEMELRQAKEEAECSSRAKTEFLAAISHELRTPLNAIIGFSDIIQQERLGTLGNATYRDYAQDIHSSGHKLLQHINDILEFTRFDSGRLQLCEGDLDLEQMLEKVVAEIRPNADAAGIDIEVRLPDEPMTLLGDRPRLSHMMRHLVSNAVKFNEAGGRVTVTAAISRDGCALLKVADNGIGMATEDLPKAYEAFAQLDSRLSRKFAGMGLGIPMARAIAKLHGASLGFESEIGVGTIAALIFPKTRVITRTSERGRERYSENEN